MQVVNTAASSCSKHSVCRTRWSWWSWRCMDAWRPAAVPSGSTDRSAAAPAWWRSSTGGARAVAAAASRSRTATCTPSVAARSRRLRTSKQPTRAYQVRENQLIADGVSGKIMQLVVSVRLSVRSFVFTLSFEPDWPCECSVLECMYCSIGYCRPVRLSSCSNLRCQEHWGMKFFDFKIFGWLLLIIHTCR